MAAKLEILLNDNGTLTMNGPIDNLGLCYMMMELAKDALRARHAAREQKIQAPMPRDVLAMIRGGQG